MIIELEFELFKNQLRDEWMKENPPFDNNKQTFEDYLVSEIRRNDANQAIQIESLRSQLKKEYVETQKELKKLILTRSDLKPIEKNKSFDELMLHHFFITKLQRDFNDRIDFIDNDGQIKNFKQR